MTRLQMSERISKAVKMDHVHVHAIVNATLDEMIRIISQKGRLEMRRFGIFEVRTFKPRTARNPKTGVPVQIPSRRNVKFAPSSHLSMRLQCQNSAHENTKLMK